MIRFTYGTRQRTGRPGLAQPLVNVLGAVTTAPGVLTLQWRLNGGPWRGLWHGPDGRRLARDGDFNIEVAASALGAGDNLVEVRLSRTDGGAETASVILDHAPGLAWPLPCTIRWREVERIGDAVQIVDGAWALTPDGIRTLDPSYDRMVVLGDAGWRDYDLRTTATVHAHAEPLATAPTFGVAHFALAARWPGHAEDGHSPRLQWYPLGATNEFQLREGLTGCRWRCLTGAQARHEDVTRHDVIALETPQALRMQVRGDGAGGSVHAVKRWVAGTAEPEGWDLTTHKSPEDVPCGGACLIAHNADVTFGDVKVVKV